MNWRLGILFVVAFAVVIGLARYFMRRGRERS
jgi:hypothetical protein